MTISYIQEISTSSSVFYDYEAHMLNLIEGGKNMLTSDLPKDWKKLVGYKGAKFIDALLSIEGIENVMIDEHRLEIRRRRHAGWKDILWRVREAMEDSYGVEVRLPSLSSLFSHWLDRTVNSS